MYYWELNSKGGNATVLIENELNNAKWLRDDNLRIKMVNTDRTSIITVMLENYNICFKMMMFEFMSSLYDETGIKITTERNGLNQIVFKSDNFNHMVLASYIVSFVREWNIKVTESTFTNSDIITDEIWYS